MNLKSGLKSHSKIRRLIEELKRFYQKNKEGIRKFFIELKFFLNLEKFTGQ